MQSEVNMPLGIGDFIASFKGDTPGHPFRGNQFEGGSGVDNGGESASKRGEIIDNLKKKGLSPVEKMGNQLKHGDVVIDDDKKVWLVTSASPVNVVASAVTAPHSDRSGLFIQNGPGQSLELDKKHIVAGNEKQYAKTIKEERK